MRAFCILAAALALHATSPAAADTTPIESNARQFREVPCNYRRYFISVEEIRKIPDFARLCYQQARSRMQRPVSNDVELQEAELEVRGILELEPSNAYGWAAFAELHLRYDDLDLATSAAKALDLAERATRAKPAIAEAQLVQAEAFRRLGCLPCAERAVNSAKRMKPGDPEVLLADALIRADQGNQDAARHFQSAVDKLTPGQARAIAHLRWGELLLHDADIESAGVAFSAAIADAPDLLRAHLRYATFLLYERGDADGAMQAAQRANKVRPSVEAKRLMSLATYLTWAQRFEQTGQVGELTGVAQRAIIAPEEAFVACAAYPQMAVVARALGRAKVVPNVDVRDGLGNTALIMAAGGSEITLVRALLDLGANMNAQNSRGERALTFAAQRGGPKVVEMLVSRGAQPDFADQDGSSPLSLAVRYMHADVTRLLLARGAKLNSAGPSGGDLLSIASRNADFPTTVALLEHGANPNATDKRDMPPLVAAVFSGSLPIVRKLLEHGADARVRFEGRSAMDYARDAGDWEIVEALEARAQATI